MLKRAALVWCVSCLTLVCFVPASPLAGADPIQKGEMAGYLLVPNEKVEQTYNAGFSMYVAAWPLLREYPGRRFQTGLFGTWMHAQYDVPGSKEDKLYSDIEGGLGWWRDTRFATETPKFIMGGVARSFSAWANGPGAGKGRDWDKPQGKYGVAQLSPWLLWPPDGVNLKQGTCGELFGYGYLPLPLTEPKTTTAGKDVPTGNNCWTLFLNTQNFKGPVAFFTPYFWSRPSLEDAKVAGMFLDARPSQPNRALQMETQYVPSIQAVDEKGETYARIAPTSFPRGTDGDSDIVDSVVVHRVTSYNKKALWDGVEAWFAGGAPATGAIDLAEASVHRFPGRGGATWKIYRPGTKREDRVRLAWSSFATPMAPEPHTFGFRWNDQMVTKSKDAPLVTLPEYFRLAEDQHGKPQWVVIRAEDVPPETGLTEHRFTRPVENPSKPYVTPDEPESCWKKPGPVAGPFYACPGDGSKVTYYWYRFADQPALLNADLTDEEREALQTRVEKLHSTWKTDRDYLPPPKTGQLADIDTALIVTPPKGFETGYVPIATRQEAANSSKYGVAKPPAEMKLDPLYAKYVDASGYPIVSSAKVNDYALKEAAYLIDMMLADRPDIRKAMVASGSRMIVMAHDELTTDIPEHAHLRPKDYWDARARGLGGSGDEPVCSCGEENLLGFDGDPYSTENILIHEFAHNIHLRGMVNLDATFDDRLKQAYDRAMANGLWESKYASTNHAEYFAEGVQSWFNNNRQPDHDHNHVDTRKELKEYDPGLAAICEEVFGKSQLVYTKPVKRLSGHLADYDPSKSPRFQWPARVKKSQEKIREEVKKRGTNRKQEYKN